MALTKFSPADAVAEIRVSQAGPGIGAFFDLDGTLVDGFTAAVHVGDRIRRRQAGVGELLGVFDAALRYRLGRLQFERLIVRAAGYLRGELLDELDALGERLFVERVASRLYSHMHEIVAAHQARGHTVVMSSSALSIQALPVARFLGISNVQCNRFELDEHGRLTGGIVKPIVWGATKAAAVQRFCADNGVAMQHSYFYADGDEDAASMSLVGCPRPVNPRSGLAAAAAAHGWPVMCLASGRRGPGRALRYLAHHVRRDRN
ncbi:HAD-IB family hydrolase [Mycobacterium sp. 852002-51057_SCH5723018]|uniref:HAD-IB family hydrolase n=1 Tax=Mycobacterium sp. 852002-51057_SCH5723018 TaxID=1834094 RepID=UPI0007FFDA9E|nr:HAD-IB family hydrolase [Mycobacterium sp. 852002-51057_SCH5723018]OBG18823.1 haloacid dehalogenase [Mycobacterium sp. 852002-51057_SCH5723018]